MDLRAFGRVRLSYSGLPWLASQLTGHTDEVSVTDACDRLRYDATVLMQKKSSGWVRNLDLVRFAEGRCQAVPTVPGPGFRAPSEQPTMLKLHSSAAWALLNDNRSPQQVVCKS